MAASNNQNTSPSPPSQKSQGDAPKAWAPPTSDQEFIFKDIESVPAWVDKSWSGYDAGPALQVPAGDIFGNGPYHTKAARVGDTVKFTVAKGATPAKFTVIQGEPDPADASAVTRKPPQQSGASLEDMLKNGLMAPDDLGPDAKAQVTARTPGLRAMVEEGVGMPAEKQSVSNVVLS